MHEPIRNKRGQMTVHALKSGYAERAAWTKPGGERLTMSLWWREHDQKYVVNLYTMGLVGTQRTLVETASHASLNDARKTFKIYHRANH